MLPWSLRVLLCETTFQGGKARRGSSETCFLSQPSECAQEGMLLEAHWRQRHDGEVAELLWDLGGKARLPS